MKDIFKEYSSRMFLGFISIAHAQRTGTSGGSSIDLKDFNPLGCDTISCVLVNIFKLVRTISVPVVAILILYGAFLILTAGAKPDNLKKGRDIITWAIVGFIIILLAAGVTDLIQDLIDSREQGINSTIISSFVILNSRKRSYISRIQ